MGNLKFQHLILWPDEDGDYHPTDWSNYIPSVEMLKQALKGIEHHIKLGQEQIDKINEDWKQERSIEYEKRMSEMDESSNKRTGYRAEKGSVYLIESNGLYKIGKAKNINHRIRKYITENPNEIKLLHSTYVEDYSAVEIAIHEKFKHKRIHKNREWFNLDQDEIVLLIAYLQEFKIEREGK